MEEQKRILIERIMNCNDKQIIDYLYYFVLEYIKINLG